MGRRWSWASGVTRTRNEAIAGHNAMPTCAVPDTAGHARRRWIDGVLNASIIEASGQRYLLGVVRDISKQKAAEAALRESEEKKKLLAHRSVLARRPVITDVETGVVLDPNRAWQELSAIPGAGDRSSPPTSAFGSTTPTATRSPSGHRRQRRACLRSATAAPMAGHLRPGFRTVSPLVAVPAICGRSPTSPAP